LPHNDTKQQNPILIIQFKISFGTVEIEVKAH